MRVHLPQPRHAPAIARGDTDAVDGRLDRPACLGLVNIDMANGDGSGTVGRCTWRPTAMRRSSSPRCSTAAPWSMPTLLATGLHLAARRRGSVGVLSVLLSDPAVQPDQPNARRQIPLEVAVEAGM